MTLAFEGFQNLPSANWSRNRLEDCDYVIDHPRGDPGNAGRWVEHRFLAEREWP